MLPGVIALAIIVVTIIAAVGSLLWVAQRAPKINLRDLRPARRRRSVLISFPDRRRRI